MLRTLEAIDLRDAPRQSLVELFASLDGDPNFTPHRFDAAHVDRLRLHRGRDRYLVASRPDGTLVGYGMLRGWDAGYALPSLGIAARPGFRGLGVGDFLMRALHRIAVEAGADQVRLRVHPDNHAALRLYARFGYDVAGDERGQLVMVTKLT